MGYDEHPQQTMKRLGITYQHSTPQSMGDQWWFWNCENVPEPLPEHFSILDCDDPSEMVGYGLSEQDAEKIKNYNPSHIDKMKAIYPIVGESVETPKFNLKQPE